MQNKDPSELVSNITSDSLFRKYYMKKFLHVVHHRMEESFFDNLEHKYYIVELTIMALKLAVRPVNKGL